VRVKRFPKLALTTLGLVSKPIRELPEMLYQFDEPFVIDATETTEVFGLRATTLADQTLAIAAAARGTASAPRPASALA
ncbi:MAG: epimerase, partial [Actinomycetota bacterium]